MYSNVEFTELEAQSTLQSEEQPEEGKGCFRAAREL